MNTKGRTKPPIPIRARRVASRVPLRLSAILPSLLRLSWGTRIATKTTNPTRNAVFPIHGFIGRSFFNCPLLPHQCPQVPYCSFALTGRGCGPREAPARADERHIKLRREKHLNQARENQKVPQLRRLPNSGFRTLEH